MLGRENQQMEVDTHHGAKEHEHIGNQIDFDLNIEDLSSDFNNDVFQDAQETAVSEHQNFPMVVGQNVQNVIRMFKKMHQMNHFSLLECQLIQIQLLQDFYPLKR